MDGGALMRQQRIPESPAITQPPINLEVQPKSRSNELPSRGAGTGTIFINGYQLLNESKVLPKNKLDELLHELSGRPVTFGEIQQAADLVTQYFQSQGYIFAKAYIPRQEIENGIVVLDVIVGKRSLSAQENADVVLKLDTSLHSHLDPEFAKSVAVSDMPPGEPIKLDQVERGLMLLNYLPGVKASGVVVPGSEPGTLGLVVQLQEEAPVKGSIAADNSGNPLTGENRVGATVAVNGISGRGGDVLGIRLSKSLGARQGSVTYAFPLAANGLKLQLIGSLLDYEQTHGALAASLNGSGSRGGIVLSYPLILTRRQSLIASVQASQERIIDRSGELVMSDRKNFSMSAGMQGSYNWENLSAFNTFGIDLTAGTLNRSNSLADLAQDAETRRTDGFYAILKANASYTVSLSPSVVFHASFEGQFPSKNLDSSERFYVGGPSGVRAYAVDEPGADSGALIRIDTRWRPWRAGDGQDFSLIGFFDWARVQRNRVLWSGWNFNSPNMRNTYSLMGAGLGLSYTLRDMGQIELLHARRIGSAGRSPGEVPDESRFWLSGMLLF